MHLAKSQGAKTIFSYTDIHRLILCLISKLVISVCVHFKMITLFKFFCVRNASNTSFNLINAISMLSSIVFY